MDERETVSRSAKETGVRFKVRQGGREGRRVCGKGKGGREMGQRVRGGWAEMRERKGLYICNTVNAPFRTLY